MSLKKLVTALIFFIVLPATVIGGALIFREKHYAWISLCVAILSCVPLFYSFERKDHSAKELTVLAVLVALSAVSRLIFVWLPAFKPITAITVIVAVCLGRQSGFAVGALSALLSNFWFGQGPWTPFQMLAWGLIGYIAGLLSNPLRRSKILLCVYGALSGVLYSLTMDVWTTVWADGTFNVSRYLASVVTALPVTVSYAVSNVIFLLLLFTPIGDKLNRIKTKYGLFKER